MTNIANGYRWVILGLATFCTMTFGVAFQSIPPILGTLVDILGITYAQAGALMGLFILPAIFLSLPGGMLVDRYGARIVGVVSLSTMACGAAIVALVETYWVIGLGRLVMGVGAAALLVVTPRIVTAWFHDREIGLAMGVFNTSVPLGTILSLNFMGVIANRFNWHTSIWTTFAVTIAALCLFLFLFRSKKTNGEINFAPLSVIAVLREAGWGIWLVGFSWGLFNAGIISFFTYAPDFFVSQGEEIAKAGLVASYPMWGSIILAPIVGMLIDRIGRKWMFVAAGSGGIAILLYLIPGFTHHAAILCMAIGVFVALLAPAIFSFPAELLPGPVMGFGFGILGTALGIGISVGPLMVGSLRDATGNYVWSFAVMAILTGLGIIPMLMLRMKGEKPPS